MLEQKTLFLNFSYLPPLFAYLLMPFILLYGVLGMLFGVFNGLSGFKETVILHSEDLLIFSRFLGAAFGLGTVYLIFKWTKELFNTASGFLAAIILALLPLHLQESQTGRFWLPMSFFILAAAYAIQQLAQNGRAKWYYWSAIFIALGYGLGLVAIILIPWYLLAHYWFIQHQNGAGLIKPCRSEKFFSKKLVISFILLLTIISFFTLANTYTVFRQFGRGVGTILDIVGVNIVVPQSSQHFLDNNFIAVIGRTVKIIWSNFYWQVVLLIIAGVGLIGQKKYWQNFGNFFLIVWPLTYLVGLAVVFNIILDRYTLPALVFFVPPTAYGLYLLFKKVKEKKYLWPIILIIFFLPQIYFTYQYSEKIIRTNTLLQAKNWLEENIAGNKRIVRLA
jgi:hypothetical protein